jgi:hypothetical protein
MASESRHGPGRRSYGDFADKLAAQLACIEPSRDGRLEYRPCSVILLDCTVVQNVYIVDAQQYIDAWGVWPEDDPGKSCVSLEAVQSIAPSLSRLPAEVANELYRAGESGMGYTVFKLHFRDGTAEAYVTGSAVDFVSYPAGKSGKDIKRVEPHGGRHEHPHRTPEYSWLLHGTGESKHAVRGFGDA